MNRLLLLLLMSVSLSALAGGSQNLIGIAGAQSVDSLEVTGNRTSVAGIEGEVHEITWTEAAGRSHSDRAVPSGDPLAAALTTALGAFPRAMGARPQQEHPVNQRLRQANLGVLCYGDQSEVTRSPRQPRLPLTSSCRPSPYIWAALCRTTNPEAPS